MSEYILNTTFVVEPAVQDRWLDLVTRHFVPFLREVGYDDIIFTRIVSIEAVDHFTYSLQVALHDISDYRRFTGEIMQHYIEIADPLFSQQVVTFNSLLKRIPV